MDVYMDLVMVLNFGVDLLLLWSADRFSGHAPDGKRLVFASALGGLYAGGCLLPGLYFLGHPFWRFVSLVTVSVVAFGIRPSLAQQSAIFIFLTMALGGIVTMLGSGGFWSVFLSALLLAVLCALAFYGKTGKRRLVNVCISNGGKTLRLSALLDTGNTLRDPVTGCPVLVADTRAAMELLQLDRQALAHPIETISRGIHPGLRLIPYTAIGQPAGMLLGLKVESIKINDRTADMIVAFAPQQIGVGDGYEALAGGTV
ncbi:MAG: hypothetical protein E7438_00580 [Ruminococcaceae bacterium]|nr:hypothetical protein [Oscillospiraceae bacterium]